MSLLSKAKNCSMLRGRERRTRYLQELTLPINVRVVLVQFGDGFRGDFIRHVHPKVDRDCLGHILHHQRRYDGRFG